MNINVFNERNNPQVGSYVRERINAVVGRFADRIGRLDVHLSDENGSKGGEDKVCSIDMKLASQGQLHVRAKHENMYAAIAKAVRRAGNVVAKTIERRRTEGDVVWSSI